MLSFPQVSFQGIQHHPEVPLVTQEVGVAHIYKDSTDIVLPDIMSIGLLDIEQIFVGNGLFIGAVPFADVFLQLADGGMQLDKDIRLHEL